MSSALLAGPFFWRGVWKSAVRRSCSSSHAQPGWAVFTLWLLGLLVTYFLCLVLPVFIAESLLAEEKQKLTGKPQIIIKVREIWLQTSESCGPGGDDSKRWSGKSSGERCAACFWRAYRLFSVFWWSHPRAVLQVLIFSDCSINIS